MECYICGPRGKSHRSSHNGKILKPVDLMKGPSLYDMYHVLFPRSGGHSIGTFVVVEHDVDYYIGTKV